MENQEIKFEIQKVHNEIQKVHNSSKLQQATNIILILFCFLSMFIMLKNEFKEFNNGSKGHETPDAVVQETPKTKKAETVVKNDETVEEETEEEESDDASANEPQQPATQVKSATKKVVKPKKQKQ